MSRMTNREHEEADHFQTRYEACYDTALSEFYSSIEEDKQSFEHYLDDTPISEVEVKVILLIATCIKLMSLKSDFHYSDDYDQIDYDFHKELSAMLLDEYGWEM